jgi:hypothetical protein
MPSSQNRAQLHQFVNRTFPITGGSGADISSNDPSARHEITLNEEEIGANAGTPFSCCYVLYRKVVKPDRSAGECAHQLAVRVAVVRGGNGCGRA